MKWCKVSLCFNIYCTQTNLARQGNVRNHVVMVSSFQINLAQIRRLNRMKLGWRNSFWDAWGFVSKITGEALHLIQSITDNPVTRCPFTSPRFESIYLRAIFYSVLLSCQTRGAGFAEVDAGGGQPLRRGSSDHRLLVVCAVLAL